MGGGASTHGDVSGLTACPLFPEPRASAFHDLDSGDVLLFRTESSFGKLIQSVRGPWVRVTSSSVAGGASVFTSGARRTTSR